MPKKRERSYTLTEEELRKYVEEVKQLNKKMKTGPGPSNPEPAYQPTSGDGHNEANLSQQTKIFDPEEDEYDDEFYSFVAELEQMQEFGDEKAEAEEEDKKNSKTGKSTTTGLESTSDKMQLASAKVVATKVPLPTKLTININLAPKVAPCDSHVTYFYKELPESLDMPEPLESSIATSGEVFEQEYPV